MRTHKGETFLRAAVLLAVAVFGGNVFAQAQTLTTIHSFPSNPSDGQEPYPQHLAIDSQGAVYGTTVTGGSTPSEWGTVFQLIPPAKPGGAWTENPKSSVLLCTESAERRSNPVEYCNATRKAL